jgi:hypothetical protein
MSYNVQWNGVDSATIDNTSFATPSVDDMADDVKERVESSAELVNSMAEELGLESFNAQASGHVKQSDTDLHSMSVGVSEVS